MNFTETSVPFKKNLFEFKSIKTKLIIIIVVMLIIAGTILTGIAAFLAANNLESAAINTLNAVGESTGEKLWLVADMGEDIASTLSVDPAIKSVLLDGRDGTLTLEEQIIVSSHLMNIEGTFSDIFDRINVLDNHGIILASTLKEHIGRDFSDREVFINQQKGSYVGEPYLGTNDIPRIPYARPVYDDNGEQLGLIYIALILPTIDGRVFSTHGLSDDSTSFLVAADGTILSGIRGDYSQFLMQKFDLSIFSAGANIVQAPGFYGDMEYIVKTPVPGTTWSVITTEAVSAVIDPITYLVMMMIVSLIIVIIIGTLVTIVISNSFTRPIKALTKNAEELALGYVDIEITHTGIDEIGQLADAFRNIVGNTRQRVDSLIRVASGDINFRIIAASDRDVEANALIQMKQTVADMAESLQTLASHSAEGDLSYRAGTDQFQGAYHDLIKTLNHAFDLIVSPIQESMRLSASYSSGDYSDRFDPDMQVNGDFVPFKTALNQIGINTSDALLKVKSGVADISTAALGAVSTIEEISTSVTTLAGSSSNVSSLTDRNDADLNQVLIAMNDLANTVGEVAQRTTAVSELARQSSDLAHYGVKQAELAGKGMEGIMEAAASNAKSVSDISSQMDEIGGIVDVISGIAEQTNLLALNAAIEAARAGNAGLGFAVVADEVKSLAQESQASAEHIGTIISHLQKIAAEMASGMRKATDAVESGNNAVNETIAIFHHMADAISDVHQNMSEVAAAAEEQAASVEEITASVSEVRNMVQDTAREATDSAVAAAEIRGALDQYKDAAFGAAQLAKSIDVDINKFII